MGTVLDLYEEVREKRLRERRARQARLQERQLDPIAPFVVLGGAMYRLFMTMPPLFMVRPGWVPTPFTDHSHKENAA